MGPKETTGSNFKYLKLKTLDKDKPTKRLAIFDQKKEGDSWVVDKEYGEFEGILVGAQATSYESVDGTKHGFSLEFNVGTDQNYKIEMNQNIATRGFINSLLNVQDYTLPVKFWTSFWKNYWGITVMEPNNSKAVRWKVDSHVLPKAEVFEVPNSSKKVITYEALERYFIKAVNALNAKATEANALLVGEHTMPEKESVSTDVSAAFATKAGDAPKSVATQQMLVGDDDLPF